MFCFSRALFHSSLPIHLRYRRAKELKQEEDAHEYFEYVPSYLFYTTCSATRDSVQTATLRSLLPSHSNFSVFTGDKTTSYLTVPEIAELMQLLDSPGWVQLSEEGEKAGAMRLGVPIGNEAEISTTRRLTFAILFFGVFAILTLAYARSKSINKKPRKGQD